MNPRGPRLAVDPNSQTWQAVEAEAEAIVTSAGAAIMQQGADERTADFERGRISAAGRILKLALPQRAPGPETSASY